MLRYRYRTETRTGPWRKSRLDAETDAIAAGLARIDGRRASRIVWDVPGEIEESGGGAPDKPSSSD